MLYGMGTVFVFLTLLVLVTTLMSALVSRFVPPAPAASPRDAGADVEPRIIAVITEALRQHRGRKR